MFNRLRRLYAHDIAIDLGTANTLIHVAGRGLVINEPSVVSLNRKSKRIVAVGERAKQMLGRTPPEIQAARPLVDGVVSDFEVTEQMLKYFIDNLHRDYRVLWPRPRMIVGLPAGVTEVEQRAVEEAARSAGARKVYLIEEPMAAAIGVGLPIMDPQASMIIDIGGGTTEVAIIANGQVAYSRSLRIAGDELSETIMQFMRDEYNLAVGEQTAELTKTEIGAVYIHSDPKKTTVRGRNIITGLPEAVELSSEVLRKPLARQIKPILETVKTVLEEAPPELVADVLVRGIVMTGGGSLIGGIDHLISNETKLETTVADNALTAVVEGAALVLSAIDQYRSVLLAGTGA
ncbi:MAG TPA: rod shape-determining protein [Candidatus Saccharimonadales bacterium]